MNKMQFQDYGLKNLFLVGVSHWNTPADVREKFSLTKEQMIGLYDAAKAAGVNSIFSISTCNRTEIYALAENTEQIVELWHTATISNQPATHKLKEHIYSKKGQDAVEHLFKVSVGLDAQILGDAQITGQIREFHQFSLENNALEASLNRLVEQAIGAGKKVKAQTQYYNGESSVAHAAVVAAINKYGQNNINSLIIGSGKTGKLTLKSLTKFISSDKITILNRTATAAFQLAKEFSVHAAKFDTLIRQVERADVIFTATASQKFLITNDLLQGVHLDGKLFVDLSLPRNIEPDLRAAIIHIDQLTDSGNEKREEYRKEAEKNIAAGIEEYNTWLHRYELAQSVKSHIAESIFDNSLDEDDTVTSSKFVDGITSRHLRHFQKGKQSRNLAA